MDAEQVLRLAEKLVMASHNAELVCDGCGAKEVGFVEECLRRAASEGWQARFDKAFCGNCCKEADGA